MPADASARLQELQQKGLASDNRVKICLESRGYAVTLLDQGTPPQTMRGYDLIVRSSVVQSSTMADSALCNIGVPLLSWENDLFDSLRFTGRKRNREYGEVEKEHYIRIVNAPHALAGCLPAGKVSAYLRDGAMGRGVPAHASGRTL